MTDKKLFWLNVLVFTAVMGYANSFKILGIIPTPVESHFFVGDALMRGLVEKGHQVTVISPLTPRTSNKNYRHVETPSVFAAVKDRLQRVVEVRNVSLFNIIENLYSMGIDLTNTTLAEPSVQKLMKSGEKFDVVICEIFVTDALLGLAEYFNASLIGVSTFGASRWTTELVGSPSPLSFVPHPFHHLTDRMTLSERIYNLAVTAVECIYSNIFYMPMQAKIFNHYFPNSKLGLENTRRNTALVLLNSHVSLGHPRPYMPNMIEVGGMHINRKTKPLPADLQKFIDEAKYGVIYFSMGSAQKSNKLPMEKREVLLQTFKSLKQRVLWKFEDRNLPGKSDNVFISNWFPQDDVLAHPNVKLFISHGGILGNMESIYHGKPLVGIPLFGDQFMNVARAEVAGYAVRVDYNDLTKETLSNAINKILTNPEYTINSKLVSERYRDQIMNPLELAIYWVEYVVRHKGARHLHSAGQELNFIQYHNLDALTIILGGGLLFMLLVLTGIYKLTLYFKRLSSRTNKVKKN